MLLHQYGCPEQAQGVYANLLSWLQHEHRQRQEGQQQQPQQQQQGADSFSPSVRLQAAAAAAAAMAPSLLAGVLRHKADIPSVKLVRG
jgi:hypothetical protein